MCLGNFLLLPLGVHHCSQQVREGRAAQEFHAESPQWQALSKALSCGSERPGPAQV